MQSKKLHIIILLLVTLSVSLLADPNFDELDKSAKEAAEATPLLINAFRWVFAIIPFGVAFAAAAKVWIDDTKKIKSGQEETRIYRILKPIGGFVAGVFVTFVMYGIFGAAYLNPPFKKNTTTLTNSFNDTWDLLVTSFWSNAFTKNRNKYTHGKIK